jgi:hypothetical protein
MGFFVIKGTFHVVGFSPDGDSIRFRADDENNWDLLGPGPLSINSNKDVQLRLEGIDSLETHFFAISGELHQPLVFAQAAADFLLDSLNITGVVWDTDHRRILQANDGTPGYILTRQKDVHGRPVAFVFAGGTTKKDGSTFFLKSQQLTQSVNFRSLGGGLAYPTYYQGLFADLRNTLTKAVTLARSKGLGLYPLDRTNKGVKLTTMTEVTDKHPIMPKLFRRLGEFVASDPPNLTGFLAWLAVNDPQPVFVISKQNFTHLDNVVEVKNNRIRLLELPENLIFTP